MSGQALWYLTRGSGVVALTLLTATTLLGVLTAGRWRSARWPRFAVAGLHRNLTLLALAFIGVHVGTTIADGYAPVGVKDIVVPFASQYRPVWLGLGALALDLLLAITITSLLRGRIGYRLWKFLHWAAYGSWPLALAHGLGSGSDARLGWMAALSFGSLALVALAVAARLVLHGTAPVRVAAGAATAGLLALLPAWYLGGPGKHGWAARAGTPTALLKTTVPAASQQLASAPAPAPPSGSFRGRLVGRMSSSGPDGFGDAAVALAAAVRGGEPGTVSLTLWGTALEGGGLSMSRSRVSFADARSGTVYSGTVVGLNGNEVIADVTSSSGTTLRLTMALRIDSSAATVTGTIRSEPSGRGSAE